METFWTPVVSPAEVPETKIPSSRSKHATVLHGQYLYLLGGRNGNVPLKDFWRYCIAEGQWEKLDTKGDFPGCLQEHSIVGYRNNLYVFGGEVGFSNGLETPLWMYNIVSKEWRKFCAPKGVVTPKGRRSHTATVFKDSMYIYGGYQDLKGSTSEMWTFHFVSETWHLISQGCSESPPPPRHRHSAVLHDNAMWVFGGMTDLQEKSDFWRFDLVSHRWRSIKSKPGPGCLNSHCAVKFLSVMMLFGGEREGQTLNDMWRFHFATEFWERLSISSAEAKPMPRSQTTAFIFSQFTTRGAVHYMGLPEQEYFGTQPSVQQQAPAAQPKNNGSNSNSSNKKVYQANTLKSFANADSPTEDIYEEIDDYKVDFKGTKFTFDPPETCADTTTEVGKNGQSNKQAVNKKQFGGQLSTRLSQLSCSYSMFSNESTESLNTAGQQGRSSAAFIDDDDDDDVEEDVTEEISPSGSSIRLKKSHSSSFSIKSQHPKNSSSCNDSAGGGQPTAAGMTRDPVSVPNIAGLIGSNSGRKCPEPAESVELLDFTERRASKADLLNKRKTTVITEAVIEHHHLAKSDSANTFQSYDTTSNKTASNGGGGVKTVAEMTSSTNCLSDDYSSLSGYESIESNYETALSKKVEDMKASLNSTSFANPHYLCPDVQAAIMEAKSNKYGEKLDHVPGESPAESLISDYHDFHARLNRDFVPDKLKKFSLRPKSAHFQPTILESLATGSSHYYQPVDEEENQDLIPKEEACEQVPMRAKKIMTTPQMGRKMLGRPTRPVSAGSPKMQRRALPSQPNVPAAPHRHQESSKKQLKLFMYIVGGREVGQVTVFRRPISIWRLDLTKTF